MQTIRQRRAIRAFSANDPRIVRVSNHRDPKWIEGPYHAGDRAVGIVMAICLAAIIAILLSERYGVDLIAGVL